MTGYLRRLATTGAAYTASSVISKLIAVALLPLYTAYLTPADYGAAEVLIDGRDRRQHRDPARDHRGAAALLLRGAARTPTRSSGPASPRCSGRRPPALSIALPLRRADLASSCSTARTPGSSGSRSSASGCSRCSSSCWPCSGSTSARGPSSPSPSATFWSRSRSPSGWSSVEDEGARGPAPRPVRDGRGLPRAAAARAAPPARADPRLRPAAADDPLRPADHARRALALLPQLHRPAPRSSASPASPTRASTASRSSSPRR